MNATGNTNRPRSVDGKLQLVTFKLGEEVYGLPIGHVREIITSRKPTRLPGSAPHVSGLINLRGEVIPVFQLRVWFGLKDEAPAASATIITEWKDERFGFQVDSVQQVAWLDRSQIDPPTAQFQQHAPHISGLGKHEGRLIILLDLDALFRDSDEDAHGRA
ncbi:MAG: purine-binding chemotaxis protein CheW [Candidatus Sericytochromatia bacterium]|nr:purine-binding chemotaxis protein CheW [Candidatus Tanganyikabacteria bacterium]